MSKNRILLIEDDQSFGYVLLRYLQMNNFSPEWVQDGDEAAEIIKNENYDLGILDIMLPKKDGFALAKDWQKYQGDTPFIFLTAKSLKIDKLEGYRLGCIDYITKPIDEEIFIAKINALLARAIKSNNNSVKVDIGKYKFDAANQLLTHGDSSVTLTERETQLLKILVDHQNQLVDRTSILKALWGKSDYFNRKSMDVFIFKLRKYLSLDSSVKIINVHGKGFMLKS